MEQNKNYGLGNYVDYQQCLGQSSSADVTVFVGVSHEPGCPSEAIDWYKSGVDFDLTEISDNSIEGSGDELELAGSTYTAIINNKIKEELKLSVKPSFSSKLWQRLSSIQMEDSLQMKNGSLIKAYLNGGFHLLVRVQDKNIDMDKVYTNLICTTLPNDVLQNWSDNELSSELTFTNIHQPHYDLKQLPEGMGIPKGYNVPKITASNFDVTASSISFTPTLTDTDNIAISDTIIANVYDKEGNLVGTGNGTSGSKLTINGTFKTTENYKVILGYYITENVPMNSYVFNTK